MLNCIKFIEILISFQLIFISTMLPVYLKLPFINKSAPIIDLPITWQIPIIIFITLIFRGKVVIRAFSIYLFLGLFIVPIFHEGGSLGYLLTPNFGYLIGIYPLIKIIDKLKKLNILEFLKTGILAICIMHIVGVIYGIVKMLYYNEMDILLYNLGSYSIGKIGYHFLMLIPLSLLLKPIKYIKLKS